MADQFGCWGIDIGQAGLKALKLRYDADNDRVLAVAFDYVPHPKILSQPDAIPEELIPQALETFLSRNEVKGDKVAISVPGQTALTRFIQLPPVEGSKVKEIVKYEARQQIPFALDDVIWDYQTLGGGGEEGGYMLEAEVGLFAMKKDQVAQHLRPFQEAGVEVDIIQVGPLALYNFMAYDILGMRKADQVVGMDEYSIILDMGADNTTLLVSNGAKIWIRNVPIGGNHFTRALTKEMKLTFAKAEHLKCNATKAPDPRAVFQALRPVFNDYVSEIQRSIGYFSSVNRDATITRVIGMGNGFRLAGLQKFLQQNLQYEVDRIDAFHALAGDEVIAAPLFEENLLTFGVPYGLALQGLDQTRIHTSLLPKEITTARTIRRKKPWAVVSAAVLLMTAATSAAVFANTWRSVNEDRFGKAESEVKKTATKFSGYKTKYETAAGEFTSVQQEGQKLVGNLETREQWLEILKAIEVSLPLDPDANYIDNKPLELQHRMKITSVTFEEKANIGVDWFQNLSDGVKTWMNPFDKATGPTGKGWLVTVTGVHYHNEGPDPAKVDLNGVLYVINYFVRRLDMWTITPPGSAPVPVRQLGISHATVLDHNVGSYRYQPGLVSQSFENAAATPPGAAPATSGAFDGGTKGFGRRTPQNPTQTEEKNKPVEKERNIDETTFTVQFVWIPTPVEKRTAEDPNANKTPPAASEGGAVEEPAEIE